MGKESFRKGIQEYLKTYAYGNATWEGLIGILDTYTDDDLSGWSHIWVNEKGMPEIAASIVGNSLIVSQKDPFGRGLNWPQDLTYLIVPKTGEPEEISVSFVVLKWERANAVSYALEAPWTVRLTRRLRLLRRRRSCSGRKSF